MSDRLRGDQPHGQAWIPLRLLPALSFQELEVAEPRYPGGMVPDLSKFPMKSNPSVAECHTGEEEAFL